MYICDGSVLAANLGVNPSLTICAVTERAMSYIAPAAQSDWNDAPDISDARQYRQDLLA
jgi:cholesterol oxidase